MTLDYEIDVMLNGLNVEGQTLPVEGNLRRRGRAFDSRDRVWIVGEGAQGPSYTNGWITPKGHFVRNPDSPVTQIKENLVNFLTKVRGDKVGLYGIVVSDRVMGQMTEIKEKEDDVDIKRVSLTYCGLRDGQDITLNGIESKFCLYSK